jgi:hypothetical protein
MTAPIARSSFMVGMMTETFGWGMMMGILEDGIK